MIVEARLTVHFQSITDTFTPHDTIFPLTSPEDLTETALSSACALHTASGSLTSSSSSLRRRRLNEITEDDDENATSKHPESGSKEDTPVIGREDAPHTESKSAGVESPPHQKDSVQQSEATEKALDATRDPSSSMKTPPARPLTAKAEEARKSSNQQQLLDLFAARGADERRQSSQSTRPTAQELNYTSAYKPKVKLGPRPSLDMRTRPQTSSSSAKQYEPRLVSTLPAGIRAAPRRGQVPQRPKSQGTTASGQYQFPKSSRAPPVPMVPVQLPPTPKSIGHPPITSSPKSAVSSPKTPGITPEKQRLMRALQLRKKQLAMLSQGHDTADQTVDQGDASLGQASSRTPEPQTESPDSNQAAIIDHQEPPTKPLEIPREVEQAECLLQDISKSETTTHILHVNVPHGYDAPATGAAVSPVSLLEAPGAHSPENPFSEGASEPVIPDTNENTVLPAFEQNPLRDVASAQMSPKVPEAQLESTDIPASAQAHDGPASALMSPKEPEASSEPSEASPLAAQVRDTHMMSTRTTVLDLPGRSFLHSPTSTEDAAENEAATKESHFFPLGSAIGNATEKTPVDSNDTSDGLSLKGSYGGNDSSTRPPTGNTEDAFFQNERTVKRLGTVYPINTLSSATTSDDNLLSDDEFMEELQDAKVEEAKPVSVAKSPISPVFPMPPSEYRGSESSRTSRAASNPLQNAGISDNGGFSPASAKARSISARSLHLHDPSAQPTPVLTVKKVNVSSGISKRIKALELFSGRDASPNAPQSRQSSVTPSSSSPFSGFRKSITGSSPKTLAPAAPVRSPSKAYPTSPPPEASKNGMKSPPGSKKEPTIKVRPDSISVTARIIRDPSDAKIEAPTNPSDPVALTLHRSPLLVERDTAGSAPYPVPAANISKKEKRRLSLSSAPESLRRESTVLQPKSEPEVNRMSFGRSRTDPALPRSASDNSSIGSSRPDDMKEDRKESRRSRLIKRMSLITSGSRRSLVGALSPQKTENLLESEPIMESEPEPPQMVDIGDVNVQFPDSLLWKRRFMRIDDQGYLVLDPSRIDDKRSAPKRYHLSEFRRPFIPDQDREELPNSILLDFLDGSSLQCACESRRGQNEILHSEFSFRTKRYVKIKQILTCVLALVDAHSAYHQLYSPRQ